ncbi:type II secretion system protein J [Candidatus Riflebacteria bacterium]
MCFKKDFLLQKRAFTLTEITICIGIMVLIFLPLLGFYAKTQKNFQRGSQIQDSLLGAAALMKQLKMDLKSATVAGKAGTKGGFSLQIEDDGSVIGMSFPIYAGLRRKNRRSKTNSIPLLSRVEYELQPEFGGKLGKKLKVLRTFTPHRLDRKRKKRKSVVANNILSLKIYSYRIEGIEYFRILITGYSKSEIIGAEATIQLFGSVAVRYFNSMDADPFWRRVEINRPVVD